MRTEKRFDASEAPWPLDHEGTRALAHSVLAAAKRLSDEHGWPAAPKPDRGDGFEMIIEGLRFAARAFAYRPDEANLSLHLRLFDALHGLRDDTERPVVMVARHMSEALRKADEPGPEVARLVESEDASVRYALAGALRLDRPAHLALLRTLSGDASRAVCELASKRLQTVEAVAAWRGRFSRDPRELVGAAAFAKLEKAVQGAVAVLDGSIGKGDKDKVAKAFDRLPNELALDMLSVALATPAFNFRNATLFRVLCAREGAEATLWALLDSWKGREGARSTVSLWLHDFERRAPLPHEAAKKPASKSSEKPAPDGDASPAERARVCGELARRLTARSFAERADEGRDSLCALVNELIRLRWPEGADPSPLLDAILAAEELPAPGKEGDPSLASPLALFAKELARGAPKALRARIEEAHSTGYPGPWQRVAKECRALVLSSPAPRQRSLALAMAKRAELSNEDRAWSLEALSGDAYDPARDPARPELVRAWLRDPSSRRAVFSSVTLVRRALPVLRDELVAGSLSLDEARCVARAAAALFPPDDRAPLETDPTVVRKKGPAWWSLWTREVDEACKARAALGPWLSLGKRVGPLRDDEWNAVRALRDAPANLVPEPASFEHDPDAVDAYVSAALELLPTLSSRWTAHERARVERWVDGLLRHIERNRAKRPYASLYTLFDVLPTAADPACGPWFARLHAATASGPMRPVPLCGFLYAAFCERTGTRRDPSVFAPRMIETDEEPVAGAKGSAGADAKKTEDDGWGDDE